MNAIFERKSIRKYTSEQVSDAQVEKLLQAAMAAPSARNMQPWEFIVVRSQDTFSQLMKVHPYAQMLKEASVAIVVCGNTQRNFEGTPYWVVDCPAAVQNILLQVTDMGLGAVWLGVYPREDRMKEVAAIFDLPEYVKPFAIISIGYPAENPPIKNKFNKERIHFEKW